MARGRYDINSLINAAQQRYGIPAATLHGLIKIESGGNINAVSPAGAFGLTQFMPGTARSYGVKSGDAASQIYGAAHYLKDLGYGKNPNLALSKYNAGPANPGGAGHYAADVLGAAKAYGSTAPVGGGGFNPQMLPVGQSGSSGQQSNPMDVIASLNALTSSPDDPSQQNYELLSGLMASKGQSQAPGGVPLLNNLGGSGASSTSASTAKGVGSFEGHPVAKWIIPELQYARQHGWKGTVTSGYRSFADQTRIYNSGVRPAAKPGTSNHEGTVFPRGAVDVSDAATLSKILRSRGSPLMWAGAKDPVHFSHPHGGSY